MQMPLAQTGTCRLRPIPIPIAAVCSKHLRVASLSLFQCVTRSVCVCVGGVAVTATSLFWLRFQLRCHQHNNRNTAQTTRATTLTATLDASTCALAS